MVFIHTTRLEDFPFFLNLLLLAGVKIALASEFLFTNADTYQLQYLISLQLTSTWQQYSDHV
jgi:hypothetical protein